MSRDFGDLVLNTRRARHSFIAALVAGLVLCTTVVAQDATSIPDRIRISERTNLSTTINGRYAGLLNRQVTGYLAREHDDLFSGRFYLFEQTRRDMNAIARPVDRSIAVSLEMTPSALFAGDAEYPSIRYLLAGAPSRLTEGASWSSQAWVTVDPRHEAAPMDLPVLVSYEAGGIEAWNGGMARRITARYATRYPLPPSDDPDAPVVTYTGVITSVKGAHDMTILLPVDAADETASTGPVQVAFVRDQIVEQYAFSDGGMQSIQGAMLLFLSGLSLEQRRAVQQSVVAQMNDVPDVAVDETPTGVRITVDALHFEPDRAILLADDHGRLDAIARSLLSVRGVRYLIVGHTADVGSTESQQTLSVERAQTIARELANRGISPDRIDVEGRGGTDPVASNDSEAGRAKNRRVEIYLVEE